MGLAAEGDEEDGVVVAAGEDWTEEEEGACKTDWFCMLHSNYRANDVVFVR